MVVLLRDGSSVAVVRWRDVVILNPGVFRAVDEARLRQGAALDWRGLSIQRTSDDLCRLCDVPVGAGARYCFACRNRDVGDGYRVRCSLDQVRERLFGGPARR